MTARDEILSRIRQALATPAAAPEGGEQATAAPGGAPKAVAPPRGSDIRRFMPPTGETFEQRVALFQAHSTELKTDFHLVADVGEMLARLVALSDAEHWRKIASHAGDLTDAACGALGMTPCRTDQPYDVADLESCDAGLSQCDALIAQTGSVLVTSRSCGGRAISVLPPHHVVLARREQLLGGLDEAFALVKARYAGSYPSMISFITGPSRTGDIERILVLGAHGPKKLTVFCV